MTHLRATAPSRLARLFAARLSAPRWLPPATLLLPALALASGGCEGPHKDLVDCAIMSPECGGTAGGTDLTDATDVSTTAATSAGPESSAGPGGTGGTGGASTGGWPDPVSCDGPPDCTDQGGGDLGPVTMPFFRGQVCVPSSVRAGDPIPMRVTACRHPCLAVSQFAYKHMFRCDLNDDPACEAAANVRFPNVTGSGCPDDVWGKFDMSYCSDYGPIDFAVGPITLNDQAYEGPASVHVPFLTNADAAEIDGGNDGAAAVWEMIEQHEQPAERTFTVTLSADATTPADCSGDGCDCYDIGY